MGSGGRFQVCISVRHDGGHFLLDCGATAMVSIRRFGVDPAEIDLIFLSHLHGDHFAGLPFFILDARYVSRRVEPLTIVGPPSVEERVRQAMEVFYPGSTKQSQRFDLRFVELRAGEERAFDSVRVTPELVVHESGAPAYAFLVEVGEKRIGYSGDAEWGEGLVRASRRTDLFICEASFYDLKVANHVDYQTLVARRRELSCDRLILTHLGQEMLERQAELEFECAEDGLSIRL